MSLHIVVDLDSGAPPYEQIRAQVAGHIRAGALHAGDRLPTVRSLAADLGVAVGTVQRAYRELEAAGLVTTRRRAGTTVAGGTRALAPATALQDAAHAFVARARAEGLTDEEITDLVRGALLR
ncbi:MULTISPECIES: GntR family transcriptional regulator [unclassified Janibacter]|uniref:GntR family transcriptional regulator n=1 Tax=unclassified Janibacter TaxID=2649294 RepID=UPI003D0146B6